MNDKPLSTKKILLRAIRSGDVSAFGPLIDWMSEHGTSPEDVYCVATYDRIVRICDKTRYWERMYNSAVVSWICEIFDRCGILARWSEQDDQRNLAIRVYHTLPFPRG